MISHKKSLVLCFVPLLTFPLSAASTLLSLGEGGSLLPLLFAANPLTALTDTVLVVAYLLRRDRSEKDYIGRQRGAVGALHLASLRYVLAALFPLFTGSPLAAAIIFSLALPPSALSVYPALRLRVTRTV